MNLRVEYSTKPQKRTRSLSLRLTPGELSRFNSMAAKLGRPLAEIVRSLCEAQYTALFEEQDNDKSENQV